MQIGQKWVASKPRYSFSGHESFPLRFAWLSKAIGEAGRSPDIFVREDAAIVLGVGKNMVRSIRHWAMVLELIAPEGKTGRMVVTDLGSKLFAPQGWDPFLEEIGTIWLLHWLLVRCPDRATTWHLAFTRWNKPYFTRVELVTWLEALARQETNKRAAHASIQRDVEVFVRSYMPGWLSRSGSVEDALDCPLIELGLIDEVERGVYRFTRGSQISLPTEVLAFAILDYWETHLPEQNSVSFDRLLYWAGSPGAAFKLSEEALAERLEKLPAWTGMSYDETAGVRTLLRTAQLTERITPIVALERYYPDLISGTA